MKSTSKSSKNKYIVVIFKDNIPEYTVNETFTNIDRARSIAENNLEELLDELREYNQDSVFYDDSIYSYKILQLPK